MSIFAPGARLAPPTALPSEIAETSKYGEADGESSTLPAEDAGPGVGRLCEVPPTEDEYVPVTFNDPSVARGFALPSIWCC